MAKPKKASAKKPAPKAKKHKMTIVCTRHQSCLKFAKDVKKAAAKIPGKSGHAIRDLADEFIPG